MRRSGSLGHVTLREIQLEAALADVGGDPVPLAQLANRGVLVASLAIVLATAGSRGSIADDRHDPHDRRHYRRPTIVFPADPADRLIYATAVEHGLELVTKDRAIRDHDHPRSVVVW